MKKIRKILYPLKRTADMPARLRNITNRFVVTASLAKDDDNYSTHITISGQEEDTEWYIRREDQLSSVSEFQLEFEWEDV